MGGAGTTKMAHETKIKNLLINNTIRLIAEGGFEKATTRAITYSGGSLPDFNMNEVYIYRLFGGKEQLYEAAFERLDTKFVWALRRCLPSLKEAHSAVKDRLYKVFLRAWSFLLQNEVQCRFYIRYYYSVYFRGNAPINHNEIFAEIVDAFSPLFKEQADVKSIMHNVFTTLLDFAIRVYNGDLEDNEINKTHIFNVLYCTMITYFKEEMLIETHISQFT